MMEAYDLIVPGSGVAGMTAALRAREFGVDRILILEKAPYVGGNSRAAGGVFATGFVAEIYGPPSAGFTWSLGSGLMCGKVVAEAINQDRQ